MTSVELAGNHAFSPLVPWTEERTQLRASSAPQARPCYLNGSQHLLVKSGGVSVLLFSVKHHFILSVLSYHGNQPQGCVQCPGYVF